MNKMKELIELLNKASEAYYNNNEIMSNYEYDALFDELVKLEKETGIILPNSPTQKVGSEVVNDLPKDKHEFPAKSLGKTKSYEDFVAEFRKGEKATNCKEAVLTWKLDGLTIQCTYEDGKLIKAVTRGNGEIGSVITHNAPYIKGLAMTIPYKGKAVFRGEATMTYSEFNRINNSLPENEEKYKNPRNLANATVQLYDSNVMRTREIQFHAFSLVYCDDMPNSFVDRLDFMKAQGVFVVPYAHCSIDCLENVMRQWEKMVNNFDIPVDGLVAAFNDAAYANSLPGTSNKPNPLVGYAFKWADETTETILRDIEWSASRTGLLNPVAIFDPVELEGTTVTRASLHNVSYIEERNLKIGDRITIYKANKIIPQIAENLDKNKCGMISIIKTCPICGEPISLVSDNDTVVAKCKNENCKAKLVGKFTHFVERDCMNVDGLSEATIEKFVEKGYLKEFADLWHLDRYKDEIIEMDGFGEKSYNNMITAIENARNTNFVAFVHALGIPNVGKGQAKLFAKAHNNDIMKFLWNCCNGTDFTEIEGIGDVIFNSVHRYIFVPMQNGPENSDCELTRLLKELHFEKEEIVSDNKLAGKTFVITGSLNHFTNREECQNLIEKIGGKTSGSVSAKTSYLINNDVTSTSGKNKKAKDLNIPIISEEDFLKMIK